MKLHFISLLLVFSLVGSTCFAQETPPEQKKKSHIPCEGLGLVVGLQPALHNMVEMPSSDSESDFPVFFMKHFTAGFLLRSNLSKIFYWELNINASIDADWGYVSDGEDAWDEFGRAFKRFNRIHVDAPIYIGGYVLRSKAITLRVFGSPQFNLRANTWGKFSDIAWDNFTINVGVGADVLTHFLVNVNYRIPFYHGHTTLPDTRFAASVGFIF